MYHLFPASREFFPFRCEPSWTVFGRSVTSEGVFSTLALLPLRGPPSLARFRCSRLPCCLLLFPFPFVLSAYPILFRVSSSPRRTFTALPFKQQRGGGVSKLFPRFRWRRASRKVARPLVEHSQANR